MEGGLFRDGGKRMVVDYLSMGGSGGCREFCFKDVSCAGIGSRSSRKIETGLWHPNQSQFVAEDYEAPGNAAAINRAPTSNK